jgi:hypothetical protein
MRLAFQIQLGGELKHRGCDPDQLMARGAELVASQAAPPEDEDEEEDDPGDEVAQGDQEPKRAPDDEEPSQPPVPATTITFYVDNRTCPAGQQVYLDGQLLGEVTGEARAAFQALAGRHSLCLIGSDSAARCGDPGTMRAAFLHDGWSVRLHCRD